MLTKSNNTEISVFDEKLNDLEKEMLDMPQVECPVTHHFGPGVYIREAKFPAKSFVLGHSHKQSTLNTLVKGSLIIVNDDGSHTKLTAPYTFVSKPGRKAAYIVDDVVFHNIFATEETDIDKLEEMFADKSEYSQMLEKAKLSELSLDSEIHRKDYLTVISEIGSSKDVSRLMTENNNNYEPFPHAVHPYRILTSPIEGKGYFLTVPAKEGSILAPVNNKEKRTPAARYVNHSCTPNAKLKQAEDGNTYLVAAQDIHGCMGGGKGDEVTVDYRDSTEFILLLPNNKEGELCH